MFTKILKYNVFNGTKSELMDYINKFSKINIISGNPEVLYNGLKNEELLKNFTVSSSIIIPDGIGTVIASRFVHEPVKEKIAGIEVMEEIIRKCSIENKEVYFLGSKEEVLLECVNNIKIKFPGLMVCGSHNGYFNIENCGSIIEEIKNKKPYALFVAMGSPRQEKFIITYFDYLPCTVFMGVGGSFDVLAGKVKRAPKWMIKLGLEWLYRVFKEPWRIKRLFSIPKFLLKVKFYKDK